jgi:TonB family protein
MQTTLAVVVMAVALGACGGSDKKQVASPADDGAVAVDDDGGSDSVLIPEEKFDEINNVFDRKTSMISRCFVAGVDAGQVDKGQKGFVTVDVTVNTSGKPEKVRIIKTSFKSQALNDCVTDMVKGWVFTDSLPKPVETSHTYVLDRF